MAETIHAESFEEFLGHCQRLGIEAAAMQKVDEIRAQLHEGGVTVGPTQQVTLIGYRSGTVVKAQLQQSPQELRDQLQQRGFQLREVWKNYG